MYCWVSMVGDGQDASQNTLLLCRLECSSGRRKQGRQAMDAFRDPHLLSVHDAGKNNGGSGNLQYHAWNILHQAPFGVPGVQILNLILKVPGLALGGSNFTVKCMGKATAYTLYRNHPKLQEGPLLGELWPMTQNSVHKKQSLQEAGERWNTMEYTRKT